MKKITLLGKKDQISEIKNSNIQKMRELFPEVWRDGRIDFDELKKIFGEIFEESQEKFG